MIRKDFHGKKQREVRTLPAIFGYVTATIATYFIGRDAENERGEVAGSAQIERLGKEIKELKDLIKKYPGETRINVDEKPLK